nr:PREDICTED: uncharacterized protein LOC108194857 [Daucus carota subsp. sativus]
MAERQTSEASDSPTRERHVREFAELQEIIRRQGEQIEKLAQELRQGRNAEAVPPPPPPPLHQMEPLYERFRKQRPPTFEGSSDPLEALDWKSSLEDIFEFMQLNDREKVSCTVHTLKKDAKIWWDVVKLTRDVSQMTWADFETLFNEKFYSEAMLSAKVNEFSRLYQGSLSVAEYARKFDRLAKFAPDLVVTEASRVNRFLEGLQPELARDVDMGRTGPLTYSQAVEKALRAEHREQKIMRVKGSTTMPRRDVPFNKDQDRFSNKRGGQGSQNRFDPNKRFKGEPQNNKSGQQPWPQCQKCGKRHFGVCKAAIRKCYKCGKEDHLIKDCPMWKNEQKKEEPSKTNARIFAITQADADASNTVVSGNITIDGIPTYALIDSGATHSFASINYLKRLRRPFENLSSELNTILPYGEILYSNQWLRAVPVCIDNHELYVDLLVLEMYDYEVILGMDWLSKYNATIDCKNKKVMFKPSEEDQFEFVADFPNNMISTVSAIQARRMLQDGCVGYFGNVLGTNLVVGNKPEEIPVVKEFLEVFPEELPGLPPDREIRFEIDLIPGTAPISKAPYRMAPAELKELKTQLNELLEEKFVRPSFSPWGAPVLFVKKKDGTMRILDKMSIESTLLERIKKGQIEDNELNKRRGEVESGKAIDFKISANGSLKLKDRICVPDNEEIKKEILTEAHSTPYSE